MEIIKEQIEALNWRLELISEEQKIKTTEWMEGLNVIKRKMTFAKDEFAKRCASLPPEEKDAVIRPIEDTISKIIETIQRMENYVNASDEA